MWDTGRERVKVLDLRHLRKRRPANTLFTVKDTPTPSEPACPDRVAPLPAGHQEASMGTE
ncbi:MAG: hypothetical protein Kow0056_08220 [Coriobacteriia bacterium]